MGQPTAPVEPRKRFEKVIGQTRLYRRNAVYYFRAIVPAELQQIIGKPEMKFSLKTKDLKEAKKRCNVASVKADAKLNHARALLNAPKPATPEPVSQEELFHQVATWFVEEEQNVVLFPRAARVHPSKYKSTMKREFSDMVEYDDGGVTDACVTVEIEGDQKDRGADSIAVGDPQFDEDFRQPTLRLDLNSVEIHKVRPFDIPTDSHSVYWFENEVKADGKRSGTDNGPLDFFRC